jgi:hypothetical protein
VRVYILKMREYDIAMDMSPLDTTKWSDRLAFDIALRLEGSGEDVTELLHRHQINVSDLAGFNKDPVFLKKVGAFRDEIKDKGVTFKMKARSQAEELLKTSWLLIHSPDVSAAVKADLIKSTVKWAGLEPKGDAVDTGNAGGVRITINLGGETLGSTPIIDAKPTKELGYDED